MRENTNILCLFFFSSILQDKTVVAALKYFGYKTVNDVPLPVKEIEFGWNCFQKNMFK